MDGKIVKKTQDTLGKIIKKPPLTEKLLNKPPFRFLHDIVTSTVKTTGFMKGLFTETEMSSENVKEKDAKLAFLQKLIDMISLVLGKTVSARTSKIIAGQEPEKTNELLQMLAESIKKKVNNDEYVQRVLKGGDSKPSSSKKDSDKKKKDDDKKSRDDKKDRDRSREGSHKDREKSRDKSKSREKVSRDGDEKPSRDKETGDKPSRDKDREKSRDRRDRGKEGDDGHRSKDRERRKHREDRDKTQDETDSAEKQEEAPSQRIPRPTSAKGSRRRHGHGDESDDGEEEHVRQRERERSSKQREAAVGEDDLPPQVAAARKLQRPSSARPAPPKVKKNEGQEEPVMMGSSNVPNLIVDKDSSDEDEGFLAREEAQEEEAVPAPVISGQRPAEGEDTGEHGGLVKKILETKKELEGGSQQSGKKTEIERSHVSDAARRKEREMIQKEIDKLRTSIQTLTRSVNPLGKILDFLQEDLDAMSKERAVWQQENRQNAVALQREYSITEGSIEPLKAQLSEIDSAISDQLDLIAAVKHNTIKNDEKIEKMLSTVTKS